MAGSLRHTFDLYRFTNGGGTTSQVEKNIPSGPHWAFCYSLLEKISYSFKFFIHQYLDPELRNLVCVHYLVLRALDTVEDDMNITCDTKVNILKNFHRYIYDGDLHISCGTSHDKVLIDQFHFVSTSLSELQKGYQEVIEDTTKRMGAGMVKYILKEVETVAEYTEYCHIVLGLVYVELSKVFHASNLMDSVPDHLSNSMGLFLQKVHIIQDFMADMNEIPRAPIYWPRQIWSKYVYKLEELTYKENSAKAVCCLNDMVTDALLHAEDCLEYMTALRDPATFQLCAIAQIIAMGTLKMCYNNIEVFRGGVKMRHGLAVKVMDGTKVMSDVYGAFYDFLGMMKIKIDNNDPNATKTLSSIEAIRQVCVDSGLLNQRTLYLDMVVEGKWNQVQEGGSSSVEGQVDPFSLFADELSLISNRLREMVVCEVPKLASAAEYFFEMGVEGKRFRPTILLLMASAVNVSLLSGSGILDAEMTNISSELRTRQQRISEITEMIHVASLLHDDVLDDADTRRGVQSLNFLMGNKLSVLAGDFLLSRACVAVSTLQNTEVLSLISTVIEHLVTGEIMQMASTSEQLYSMDHYMRKTYYKTASLIAYSCKSIAILAGQTTEVAMLAYDYGRNLGLACQLIDDVLDFTGSSGSLGKGSLSDIRHGIITAPILFAIEEFPELQAIVNRGFHNPKDVDLSLECLGKSCGIERAIELATEHANLAVSAINSLPQSDDDNVRISRQALVDLTQIVITRKK